MNFENSSAFSQFLQIFSYFPKHLSVNKIFASNLGIEQRKREKINMFS